LNLVTNGRWQSTQIPLNFNSLVFNEWDILQQFQKTSFILINGHTAQLEFEEILHLSVIVSFSQVFLLEIPLKLLPRDLFLSNVLHLHKLIPPHGGFSFQLVHCNSSFCMGRIILQLEVFLHAQQPCLGIFLLLMFSIKCWRFNFVHLSFQFLPSRFSMFSGRGWARTVVCLPVRMFLGVTVTSATTPRSNSSPMVSVTLCRTLSLFPSQVSSLFFPDSARILSLISLADP
jgi:hypothetical protein